MISALRRFEATRNLPVVPVQVYWTDPAPKTDDSGRVEWELDTQASTGMAPNVSQLRLYFGSDLSVGGLATSLQTWASDPYGPNQVNASIGLCEDNPALDGLSAPRRRRAASRSRRRRPRDARSSPPPVTPARAARSARPPSTASRTGPSRRRVPGEPTRTRRASAAPCSTRTAPRRTRSGSTSTRGITPAVRRALHRPARRTRTASRRSRQTLCVSQPNGHALRRPGRSAAAPPTCPPCPGTRRSSSHGFAGLEGNGYDMVDYDPSSNTYADHFAEGGTSLSSPLWAGMWARVNAAHQNAQHKPAPLGNANAVLYQVAASPAGRRVLRRHGGSEPAAGHAGLGLPDRARHARLANIIKAADDGNTKALLQGDADRAATRRRSRRRGRATAARRRSTTPTATRRACRGSAPQLDILHGDVALSSDGTKVRAALTVAEPDDRRCRRAGLNEDWIVYWTQPDNGVGAAGRRTRATTAPSQRRST